MKLHNRNKINSYIYSDWEKTKPVKVKTKIKHLIWTTFKKNFPIVPINFKVTKNAFFICKLEE